VGGDNLILEWGLLVGLIFCGGYFSVRTKFFAIRNLGKSLRSVWKPSAEKGGISTFSSLCTTLGATVGIGNIVGVASAISLGGPGALFWMLAVSILGMSIKMAENILGSLFRKKGPNGFIGGPFMYMEQGLGKRFKPLASVYALACIFAGICGMGTIIQSSSVCNSAAALCENLFSVERTVLLKVIISILVTAITGIVILGGGNRIAKISSYIVPIMSAGYVLACLIVLYRFRSSIPGAVFGIFKNAFTPVCAAGAAAGISVKQAILIGAQRGIFSNEAGLGTSSITSAAAASSHALQHGYLGIVSVFIDTVVLCTLTGLAVIVTGATGETGMDAAMNFWEIGISAGSKWILQVFLMVFGYTSILGWNFYVERSVRYLFSSEKIVRIFQIIYLLTVFIGPFLSVNFAWKMADWTNALMAIPNLIALFLLRNKVLQKIKEQPK